MKNANLNIALIQSDILWENIPGNLEHFSAMVDKITDPVDLVVLPEMFSTGFTTNTEKCAEKMDGAAMRFLEETSEKKNCLVTGSILIAEGGGFYNRLVCMFPGGKFRTYDKRHLFRLSEEFKVLNAGSSRIIVRFNGWNLLPLVCYDLRFPVWSKNTYRDGQYEYDLLVYPSNWPQSRSYAWKSLLVARAIENQVYVIGVNRIGNDGFGTRHSGGSMVIDPKGMILSEGGDREEILQANLSLGSLREFRKSYEIGADWDKFTIEI